MNREIPTEAGPRRAKAADHAIDLEIQGGGEDRSPGEGAADEYAQGQGRTRGARAAAGAEVLNYIEPRCRARWWAPVGGIE
jgi:hypothetical protein